MIVEETFIKVIRKWNDAETGTFETKELYQLFTQQKQQ